MASSSMPGMSHMQRLAFIDVDAFVLNGVFVLLGIVFADDRQQEEECRSSGWYKKAWDILLTPTFL
jgi:hypothetical protein